MGFLEYFDSWSDDLEFHTEISRDYNYNWYYFTNSATWNGMQTIKTKKTHELFTLVDYIF